MIYLDNNATTQPTPRVIQAMLRYHAECYFNASALTAAYTEADRPRFAAARAMATLLNAEDPDCFTFTSGATESNNWVFSATGKMHQSGQVLISAIEHPSVTEPAAELGRAGFEVIEVPVDAQGIIRRDALDALLSAQTVLVSIMAANNETGVVEPISEIGRLIRDRSPSALFHTDATQAVGKTPIDLQSPWEEVDLLSFSAHKFHGPKGIGGLYIRPGIELRPMLVGGGQERGLRSGTLNTPALAGLAAAADDVTNWDTSSIRALRDLFEAQLLECFPLARIHSKDALRLPNTSLFSIPGQDGEQIVASLAGCGVIVGVGAACSSGAISKSKTLRAMGASQSEEIGGVRVSLSQYSNRHHIDAFMTLLKHKISALGAPLSATRTDGA